VARFGRLFRDGLTAFAALALLSLLASKMNNRQEIFQSGGFFVIDGDTLSRQGERLRLLGIDAPERDQQCERSGASWACGREARDLLVKLLKDGGVECRGGDHDRYGRLLATCRAGGIDLNREMVRRGMAVSYGAYRAEEAEARAARAGLWAGNFERPADYRRDEQIGRRTASDPFSAIRDAVRRLAGMP